jgi:hypothetical protein
MVALLLAKHYLNVSDEQLIERLNTDFALQYFCGINLDNQVIKDKDLVGRVRKYVAKHLDIDTFQTLLARFWKKDIERPERLLMDATCYESYIRYPTDVKILAESCQWVFSQLSTWCKAAKIRTPRSKYKQVMERYLSFAKMRKKSHDKTQKMISSLLKLLSKGISYLHRMINEQSATMPKGNFQVMFWTVKMVFSQQKAMFESGTHSIQNRIVSLHKPYLRPIVRGKEQHPVEFGMKLHKIQVGGISFIQRSDFNAFNEGKELKKSVLFHYKLFDVRCKEIGADAIYGSRENRAFCQKLGITTNFVPLGRKSKKEDKQKEDKQKLSALGKAIGKARSTVLEGSFGNEKNHYGLDKIKAKEADTEIIWVLFGIMASNAVKIADSRHQRKLKTEAEEADRRRLQRCRNVS